MEMKKMLNGNIDNPLKHAAGLSAVWQRQMSEFYAPQCRTLIDPEHGQLKRLKQSLGMKKATEVVEYAIRNWATFTPKAAKDVGEDMFPTKPSVGWLLKYQATAVMMLQEELQSAARKKAEEEQAKNEARIVEAAKVMPESQSKEPTMTLLCLTPEQFDAYINQLEEPHNEAWVDRVSEKYGDWRPARENEKGIPCDVELKKAG